jgi:ankyrin repeat protein
MGNEIELYLTIVKAWEKGGLPAIKQHITAGHDYTPHLLAAASEGYTELVQHFLTAGANGSAALCDAFRDQDEIAVEQLMYAGADVSRADAEGRTPLHAAAAAGADWETMKSLLAAGAQGCAVSLF